MGNLWGDQNSTDGIPQAAREEWATDRAWHWLFITQAAHTAFHHQGPTGREGLSRRTHQVKGSRKQTKK